MKLVDKKGKRFSLSKPKHLNRNVSRKVSIISNKNTIGHKPLSNEETDTELTLINVSNLSVRYKEILLKKPVVILERIPLLDSLSVSLKTQGYQYQGQQYRKHIMVEVDADTKKHPKVSKVRFTTPEHHAKRLQTSSHTAIRKTPLVKLISCKRSSSASNTSADKNVSNFEFKKRCSSMSNINTTHHKNSKKIESTPSSVLVKRKLNIENQGKSDTKTQSTKTKIPNFAEIHKQMFDKMESLVDNKKRLIQQYEALKTPTVSRLDKNDAKQPTSIGTKNKSYNRFGFKLKKADAVNIVLRKQQTNVQKEKKEENKAFLKGVRTNRRFELQMKMRKISD